MSMRKSERLWIKMSNECCITLLLLRALAICCAPLAPISLYARWSVVSVYNKKRKIIDCDEPRVVHYLVVIESISNMLCSFGFDMIIRKVDCGQCLQEKAKDCRLR